MSEQSEKTQILKKTEGIPSSLSFLVLEDMDNLRAQMISDLKAIGVAGIIFEAANVQAAIKVCSTEKIDFIISDWNLPDGTGHDFLKKIRTVERYKKTPFVMCTTNSEINFFLEAIASGANDYIVKPWTQNDLKKKIQLTLDTVLNRKQ